jgi:hypothetical protein
MLNYKEYLLENKIYQLILESKVEFSKKFQQILKMMKNPIADEILKLQGVDKDITQNFIDSNFEDPNLVSFIQDNTAQKILDQDRDIWIVKDSGKMLKFNNFRTEQGEKDNRLMYSKLGLDMSEAQKIENNKEVKIIKEEISSSDKMYCHIETIQEPIQRMVINKKGLNPKNSEAYKKIWTQSRNSMRIGRFIRRLIPLTGKNFRDAEIESFVNDYKSTIDILNDAFIKFDVVQGMDIYHWYRSKNCINTGTLGGSCMLDTPEDCLYIYTQNPDVVKLVILYDDNGEMKDGKYSSNKIAGRALLWKTNEGDMFMDRIYYSKEEQLDLFKKYAEKMEWWTKKVNNSSPEFDVIQGESTKSKVIYTVNLKNWDWGFPYLDSLPAFNNGKLTNDEDTFHSKWLQETWDHYDDEDYDGDDEEW